MEFAVGERSCGFWSKVGFALAIGGIGVSIALFFAIYIWREMPRWVARVGFVFGIFLCTGAIACFVFIPEPKRKWMIIAFDLDTAGSDASFLLARKYPSCTAYPVHRRT
ncbi:MAG: hypothetical protein ABSF87_18340 [Xanthobacteraceae bacterium]|jgi:hypothetical protein